MSFFKKLFNKKSKQKAQKKYSESEIRFINSRTRTIIELQMQKTQKQIEKKKKGLNDRNNLLGLMRNLGQYECLTLLLQFSRKAEAASAFLSQCQNEESDEFLPYFQTILWLQKTCNIKSLQFFRQFCLNYFKGTNIEQQFTLRMHLYNKYPILQCIDPERVASQEIIFSLTCPFLRNHFQEHQYNQILHTITSNAKNSAANKLFSSVAPMSVNHSKQQKVSNKKMQNAPIQSLIFSLQRTHQKNQITHNRHETIHSKNKLTIDQQQNIDLFLLHKLSPNLITSNDIQKHQTVEKKQQLQSFDKKKVHQSQINKLMQKNRLKDQTNLSNQRDNPQFPKGDQYLKNFTQYLSDFSQLSDKQTQNRSKNHAQRQCQFQQVLINQQVHSLEQNILLEAEKQKQKQSNLQNQRIYQSLETNKQQRKKNSDRRSLMDASIINSYVKIIDTTEKSQLDQRQKNSLNFKQNNTITQHKLNYNNSFDAEQSIQIIKKVLKSSKQKIIKEYMIKLPGM